MKTDSVLYWIIYFIVTVIVAWIALSLILLWFRPVFYNANGSVNWWTTLWVAALIIIFAWLIMVILTFIIGLFAGGLGGCHKTSDCANKVECPSKVECPPKVVEYDPCADKKVVNAPPGYVPTGYAPPAFEPRMWMY